MAGNIVFREGGVIHEEYRRLHSREYDLLFAGKQRKEQEYLQQVKAFFPKLLRRIAEQQPHAIVFLDTSARPFAWLASKLWDGLELKKKPHFYFVSSNAKIGHQPAIDAHTEKITELAKRKLKGRVVVFDEYVDTGLGSGQVLTALKNAGLDVSLAAFYSPYLHEGLSAVNAPAHAPWRPIVELLNVNERVPLTRAYTRVITSAEPLRTNSRNRAYFKQLHEGIDELAREIIELERKK